MTEEQRQLTFRVKEKVRLLAEKLLEANQKISELENLNSNLSDKLASSQLALEAEKKRYADLKLANSISGGSKEEREKSEKRINKLVREIDKCIELLND